MIVVEAVKRLTGCSDEDAELQLELAESDILRETNRTHIPSSLLSAQIDIAVIRINRQGSEGETGRSQGGITTSFDSLPEYLIKLIRSQRLAGVGGHAFEQKQNADVSSKKANT